MRNYRLSSLALLALMALFAVTIVACSKDTASQGQGAVPQTIASNTPLQATDAVFLAFARQGKLAEIMAATGHLSYPQSYYDRGPETNGDMDAYKWMLIASDFGHTQADKVLDNLRELSSLRYDGGQLVTGHIHYELGLAYLTGTNGLPIDFAKAERHLREGFPGVSGVDIDLKLDRNKLTGRAREVFDSAIPAQKKKRVRQKTNSS